MMYFAQSVDLVAEQNWFFIRALFAKSKRYGFSSASAILLCWQFLFSCVASADVLSISSTLKANVANIYGISAVRRLHALENLLVELDDRPRSEQLRRVNHFYNRLNFISDEEHWSVEDYWATPIELVASNGGDCEDFAIAKYLTLRRLGFTDAQLRLTYVKAIRINQAHMVLTYFPSKDAEPLVLDNLIEKIKPASLRDDLKPVYSFNGQGLWLAPVQADLIGVKGDIRHGTGDDITMWKDLRRRLAAYHVATPGQGGS